MSRKLVFAGPPGVGKTTLRKIFFEGDLKTYDVDGEWRFT